MCPLLDARTRESRFVINVSALFAEWIEAVYGLLCAESVNFSSIFHTHFLSISFGFCVREKKTLTRHTLKYSWLFINCLSLVCDLRSRRAHWSIATGFFSIACVRAYVIFRSVHSYSICNTHIFQYFNTISLRLNWVRIGEKLVSKRFRMLNKFFIKTRCYFDLLLNHLWACSRWPCWSILRTCARCTRVWLERFINLLAIN